ncbi:MAG: nuclear transport factor 2 family protein [Acidiferrobacterales bacterium]
MKLKGRNIVIGSFVVVVLLAWYFWDSAERDIRELLADGEAAVEAEDITRTMSHVSRQYMDEIGLNYLGVRRIIGWAFNRFDGFDVRLHDISITIDGDMAKATGQLQVLVLNHGENAYLIAESGTPDLVTITLVKRRLAWKVISVNGIDVSRFRL